MRDIFLVKHPAREEETKQINPHPFIFKPIDKSLSDSQRSKQPTIEIPSENEAIITITSNNLTKKEGSFMDGDLALNDP